jgi:hypothetical protein
VVVVGRGRGGEEEEEVHEQYPRQHCRWRARERQRPATPPSESSPPHELG